MTWAIVRVRGSIHAKHDLVQTLGQLRLNRPNHVAIVPENAAFKGMADKVQGYVTWGPVSDDTVALLYQGRTEEVHGILPGEPPSKEGSSIQMFRLRPPKGGWKSTKKPYSLGGALGFRPADAKLNMDAVIRRML